MTSKIIHQQQTHDMGCAHACIAMVLGLPVAEVVEKFRTLDGGMTAKDVQFALTLCGASWNAFVFSDLVCPGVYIAGSPSLNDEAGSHCIVLEVKDDYSVVVHDPQRGRPGKKYYSSVGGDGVRLKSWNEPVYVVVDQAARLPKEPVKL